MSGRAGIRCGSRRGCVCYGMTSNAGTNPWEASLNMGDPRRPPPRWWVTVRGLPRSRAVQACVRNLAGAKRVGPGPRRARAPYGATAHRFFDAATVARRWAKWNVRAVSGPTVRRACRNGPMSVRRRRFY